MTPKKKGDGFAALLEYKPEKRGADATDADEEDGDAAQYRAVADVLASIPFREKGLEVAVLVRSNKQGSRCADVLRRRLEGVAVVHEGVGGIVDNPVVTLLLALVRYAAHPGDTLVEGHVQMSPLFGACLDDTRMSALPLALLSAVHERGFAPVLREWGDKLIAVGALQADDAFGHQRLREFLAAAETFDATGSRDADAFEDHIRAGTVKAQAAANAVRVMTIHQSKGLGFDIVIVPFDSRARSFTDMRSTTLLMNDANAPVAPEEGWLLKTPKRQKAVLATWLRLYNEELM